MEPKGLAFEPRIHVNTLTSRVNTYTSVKSKTQDLW
jgi:hypothetical protein